MEYLQRTACANTLNDTGESTPEEDSVEDGIAKSIDRLLAVFEGLMAPIAGPFVDREVAALRLANELARRWCEAELVRQVQR